MLHQLARRIFFSFCKIGSDYMTVEDIGRYFATPDDADAAFAIFDADSNGDASFEEVEIACMHVPHLDIVDEIFH